MTVLSKAFIQTFYQGLSVCRIKTNFDRNFLQSHTLDNLYTYTTEQWIPVFVERLKELQIHDFAFDWTQMGAVAKFDWAKSKNHANYYWYHLANAITKSTDKHISEVLFAGVDIAQNDRRYLNTLKQCASFIYSDGFGRLEFINRILTDSEHHHCLTGYDRRADEYPISPFEIMQMRNKLLRPHPYFRPLIICDWNDFHNTYIETWRAQSSTVNSENLIYPLFAIVATYFKEIATPVATGETHSLLSAFYKQELLDLKPSEVTFFLGQCIEAAETNDSSLFLLDVLLKLMEPATKHDLNAVLPLMVKLGAWITQQNPAMLIEHPDILEIYRRTEVGPYLTWNTLIKELEVLISFSAELSETDVELIIDTKILAEEFLSKLGLPFNDFFQRSSNLSNDFCSKIRQIFASRDMHNQSETFTDINKTGIFTGSYEYVYHRSGLNEQFIRIARLLTASGFLKHLGIGDYFQLLMPDLASPVDNVTGEFLSQKPLSHYARVEGDRSYLANLNNSESNYELNDKCFYNVNTEKPGPFSLKEFGFIQAYSARRFRKYSRIPKFTQYRLNASTIQALFDLVNNSLNYDAAHDGDGYLLREGFLKDSRQIEEKVVEYQIEREQLRYRVRDSWNMDRVHEDFIEFQSKSKLNAFLKYNPTMRLMFILSIAIDRGHARSNLSITKYYNAYQAYIKFKQFYLHLDPEERRRLNKVSMRYAGKVRTFGEVWSNGFPDCMSAASKWFSTLIIDYLPMVEFCSAIEYDRKHNEYLVYARRDTQQLYKQYLLNDLTDNIDELIALLTHVSVQTISFAAIKARGMQFLGFAENSLLDPKIATLLSTADEGGQLNPHSMFNATAVSELVSYHENNFDTSADHCGSGNTSIESSDLEAMSTKVGDDFESAQFDDRERSSSFSSVTNFSVFSRSGSRASSFGHKGQDSDTSIAPINMDMT